MSGLLDFPEKSLNGEFHASRDNLVPTLPGDNPRYFNEGTVTCTPIDLPAWTAKPLALPEMLSIPRGWDLFVHPEGKVYFRRQSRPVILTESYICRPDVFSHLLSWIAVIEDWIEELSLGLHEFVHVWVQLTSDQSSCMYSLIDHAQRSVFWLEPLDTDMVGLPEAASQSHLSFMLQEQYWAHVEHFPMGIGRLPSKLADQLIDIFTHACADNITSPTSTSPYPLEECTQILQLLRDSQDHLSEAGTICFIARIWTFVCHNRYLNHHGQEVCRMSRDQKINSTPPPKSSVLLAVLSCLGLSFQRQYCSKLHSIYCDSLVYQHVWKAYVHDILEDWKMWSQVSFALLIANILTLPMAWSQALTLTSALLCLSSLVMSIVLHLHITGIPDGNSFEASTFLWTHCGSYGFAPLALVYSLPRSLFAYALICFCVQAVCMLFPFVDASSVPIVAGAVLAVVGVAAIAIGYTLHTPSMFSPATVPGASTWPSLTSWLRSKPTPLPQFASTTNLVDLDVEKLAS